MPTEHLTDGFSGHSLSPQQIAEELLRTLRLIRQAEHPYLRNNTGRLVRLAYLDALSHIPGLLLARVADVAAMTTVEGMNLPLALARAAEIPTTPAITTAEVEAAQPFTPARGPAYKPGDFQPGDVARFASHWYRVTGISKTKVIITPAQHGSDGSFPVFASDITEARRPSPSAEQSD
ncbi:hypothetical protein DQ384_38525 [Sphaerisporangium album]|uniref:Uncharacterized protein n=1 Tax=Sphaerisporangium album TaxID=509200 RepID=A0A367ELW6_9ACTN|nr:hypothetical protein [Sphaerisporangium album]RCG19031.1 hypothetical protein DQ384_38525 [Sphaerisporangium album]